MIFCNFLFCLNLESDVRILNNYTNPNNLNSSMIANGGSRSNIVSTSIHNQPYILTEEDRADKGVQSTKNNEDINPMSTTIESRSGAAALLRVYMMNKTHMQTSLNNTNDVS